MSRPAQAADTVPNSLTRSRSGMAPKLWPMSPQLLLKLLRLSRPASNLPVHITLHVRVASGRCVPLTWHMEEAGAQVDTMSMPGAARSTYGASATDVTDAAIVCQRRTEQMQCRLARHKLNWGFQQPAAPTVLPP